MVSANPLSQRLLGALFRAVIGPENQRLYETLDWEEECSGQRPALRGHRIRESSLVYPLYYTRPNFHGIPNGYLNPIAAVTYDAVTAFASPPNEAWVRQQLIKAVSLASPHRILDLGCGTGSSTLLLKQSFPKATITGLDLSPYMLIVAQHKAQRLGLPVQWQQGLAEATGLAEGSFDLVTASFLLHETPPDVAQRILGESYRLLKPGGQILILDGDQRRLRHANWLIRLFQEPYSQAYAGEDVACWLESAGFQGTRTRYFGWIHQITEGTKPRP